MLSIIIIVSSISQVCIQYLPAKSLGTGREKSAQYHYIIVRSGPNRIDAGATVSGQHYSNRLIWNKLWLSTRFNLIDLVPNVML